MLEDFMLQLPDHLSTKTRHNIMAILHKMLSDALNRREIGRVPRFPKLELTEPEIKWLQPEEQNALLAEVDTGKLGRCAGRSSTSKRAMLLSQRVWTARSIGNLPRRRTCASCPSQIG
jgi:hypothetical protein